jgi:uncharacterized Zn-finger protein
MDYQRWKCDGKTVPHDGHPLIYIPLGEKCPYCGRSNKEKNNVKQSRTHDKNG